MPLGDIYFEYTDSPLPSEEALLLQGINAHAMKTRGMKPVHYFAIYVRLGKDQKMIGGLKGLIYYGALYIDLLWVPPEYQRTGLGRELMKKAEEYAKKAHCSFATLETMDWEALSFYKKLGYSIEFVREGFENDSKMYSLRKKL